LLPKQSTIAPAAITVMHLAAVEEAMADMSLCCVVENQSWKTPS
jgi:hypothetical protein